MSRLPALLCAALALGPISHARAQGTPAVRGADPFLGLATYRLWDTAAPGAHGATDADVPTLTLFRPHAGTGNGTAVIVAPGGAYRGLAANLEGRQVADWLTSRGVTAFVLRYRLGSTYLYPTPLVDARRAIRYVRAHAADLGIAPDRVGMMGFSAGGHLTAMAGTMFEPGSPSSSDPVERASSRPDFVVLGYPWLNAMTVAQTDLSYCGAMGLQTAQCTQYEQYAPVRHVTRDTSPAFIYHTTDDALVPVATSVEFYRALVAAGVSAEMHLFARGAHGSGLGLGDPQLDRWPSLLEEWLRARGLLTIAAEVAAARQRAATPPAPRRAGAPFSLAQSIGDLTADARARAVLVQHLGETYVAEIAAQGAGMTLGNLAQFDPDRLPAGTLAAIDRDLGALPH